MKFRDGSRRPLKTCHFATCRRSSVVLHTCTNVCGVINFRTGSTVTLFSQIILVVYGLSQPSTKRRPSRNTFTLLSFAYLCCLHEPSPLWPPVTDRMYWTCMSTVCETRELAILGLFAVILKSLLPDFAADRQELFLYY